ncbi:partial Leucine-, isoleucine-, valine-, threonine-, and alanine-binding protein, partial [Planctomycetaceae bacterium]
PKLTKLAEGALEDCYFCNHYHPDDPNPKLQAFLKAYKAKNKETPNSLAALGYDAMYIIKQAIETAGELDRKKIADALRNTKGFDGVTGKFDIDKDRNAEKPVTMLKIKGDEFKFVRQIKPDEMK